MNTTPPYHPKQLEHAAQQDWETQSCFRAREALSKEKFYSLCMFPYPSGQLHMGHVRNYTLGDVIARYQRMLGKHVLQPMGWDAFGLPAENAAIKHKVPPAEWTKSNIAHMREQLKQLGFAYDWSREFATCEPDYYRWEQWLFLKLYEKGLVYRKEAMVNWDPVDQTVLANEQVVDGKGWRSGAPIERRKIYQWFLNITAYADELLDSLDQLTEWPEQVRTMQRNWIGRSEGVEITFKVAEENTDLHVFTTRPDTLYGVSYLAIAPQHPLALKAAEQDKTIAAFLEECSHIQVAEAELATVEKRGIATPFFGTHPLTGEPVPIWVANFVIGEYGTGAVMAVPGHDQRDFEFAQQYQLPTPVVIEPADGSSWDHDKAALTEKGLLVNSGPYTGMDFTTAFKKICDDLEEKQLGQRQIHFRLRDWGVSRQRYWGAPIPMIHCPQCDVVPVPEDQLPVVLPEDVAVSGTGSPLHDHPDFAKVTCPKCGNKDAKRETDTFDTFMESSWYYARFACPDQNKAMLDDRAKYWTPVDQYIGGVEHAVMHLLYARFIHKTLRDLGLVNSDEPFTRLLTQGMVLKDGAKMSKSKGNTVDPQTLIERYGADTVRTFMMFAAPPDQSLEWSDSGVEGAFRFLKRVYNFATKKNFSSDASQYQWNNLAAEQQQARQAIHLALQQALYDYGRLQFNTVVSSCMKLLNTLESIEHEQLHHEGLSILLRLLAPIAPHLCHALWQTCGYGELILDAPCPTVAKEALKTDSIELVVQVNGKRRAQIRVAVDAAKEEIEQLALADADVQRHLQGKTCKRVIVVPKKLVNLVV